MAWPKGKPRKVKSDDEQTTVAPADLSQEASAATESRQAVRRKSRNIIGRAMPYVPPKPDEFAGSSLGFRPKKPRRRIIIQPNPV